MRILELFCGYGTASFALKQLGIPYELIGYSDIDKYANQCFKQNHCQDQEYPDAMGNWESLKELGDVTKINPNDLSDFDLLTGGFPCQAFSVAGKNLGELDTRGTLFNEIIRIAEVKNPRYMMLENVKGLMSKRHKPTFDKIISELYRVGYFVKWKVLNTKEHGIPQNRERVFFVCFKSWTDFCNYEWPKKEELKIFLKDILEEEVDEKYYLKQEQLDKVLSSTFASRRALYQGDKDVCSCLAARDYKEPKIIQVGMINQTCKKRVHDTPKEINEFLKANKGLWTLTEISVRLELPKTQVEHYFRTDQNRAIPSPKVWKELKELLCFRDDYDSQVMEIYEKEIEFESTRRVYSDEGCSPTISSTNADKIIQLNNPKHSSDRIYSREGISPTLQASMGLGGGNQPFIAASRGRNIENPSDRTLGNETEQRLEPKTDGTSNTISTVQKDNYVVEPIIIQRPHGANRGGERATNGICPSITSSACWEHNNYLKEKLTIRKLTPIECFRLQGFLEDEVNLGGLSNTQRYKLAGNGQSVNVVKKIFKQMFSSPNLNKENKE